MSFGCSSPSGLPFQPREPNPSWRGLQPVSGRILDRLEGLAGLEAAWNELNPASGDPTRSFAWLRACAEAFDEGGDLRVLLSESDGRIEAALPLVQRMFPGARYETLGSRELCATADVSHADEVALDALVASLARTDVPIAFPRILADSPTVAALEDGYRGKGWVRTSEAEPLPYVSLDSSWTNAESHLTAERRHELRGKMHAADGLGGLDFEVFSPCSGDELVPLLRLAGPMLGLDGTRGAFYRRYARRAAELEILRIFRLRIGGQTAAMQLAVEADERFWLLRTGWDERFAHCSPLALLMLHTLEHAAFRRLRTYEFLGRPEPWMADWAPNARACLQVRVYPLNGGGYEALCDDEKIGDASLFPRK